MNIRLLFVLGFLFCPSLLLAEISKVRVIGATNTQAVLSYTPPNDNPCTVEVSESPVYAPLVHDVDPVLFPNSNLDTRPSTVQGTTVRHFVIGHRRVGKAADNRLYSRALQAYTQHYFRIRCGDDEATGGFATQNLPMGDSFPEPPPFHSEGFGNYGWPTINFSDQSAGYLDPLTGLLIKRVTSPNDWAGRTASKFAAELSFDVKQAWMNQAGIASGTADSLATTSSTDAPIFAGMPPNYFPPGQIGGYAPNFATDNFGVKLNGTGTDTRADLRTIQVCLSVDSGLSCYTDPIDVVLPRGRGPEITVPEKFPQPVFGGWSRPIPRHLLPIIGKGTIADGVLQVTTNVFGNPPDTSTLLLHPYAAGTKIMITGSAPTCDKNLCTIASVEDSKQLTLVESSLNIKAADFRMANFGVRITKKLAGGSVSVSASFETVWSNGYGLPVLGSTDQCGHTPVTASVDADGVKFPDGRTLSGFLCVIPNLSSSSSLYFFSTETGESRLLSVFRTPDTIAGHQNEDLPNNPIYPGPITANFDPEDPNTILISSKTRSGKRSLFRLTYKGDYRALRYNYPASTAMPANPDDRLVWQNLTKPSEGRDLQAQIDRNYPDFNKTRFGDFSDISGRTVTGHYMGFVKNTGFQDSPCWIFLVNVQTGLIETGFNTYDGKFNPKLRWTGCHSADGASIPNFVSISTNVLQGANKASLLNGPFQTRTTSLQRNGTFVKDTSVAYPIDNSYDNSCPDSLSQEFKDLGAVGNRCITVRVEGEPCSEFATDPEKAFFPCPWDSSRSMVQPIQEGDLVTDIAPLPGINSERLRVVQKTVIGSELQLVLQRNVATTYCVIPQSNLVQGRHLDGWQLTMAPGSDGTCDSGTLYVNGVSKEVLTENRLLVGGHFDLGTGAMDGNFTHVGSIGSGYSVRYNHPSSSVGQPEDYTMTGDPTFENTPNFPGTTITQSYPSIRQWNAAPEEKKWVMDFRHLNGTFGVGLEYIGVWVGGDVAAQRVEGTKQIYKVNLQGPQDYKRFPILSFAGRNLLKEKSNPQTGDTLTDEDNWRFCYAYRDGECRSDSSAKDLYLNVPLATLSGHCFTGQYSVNTPCAFTATSHGAWVTQADVSRGPKQSLLFRRLTMGFSGPGRQYSFANARPTPDGKWAFVPGFWIDGQRQEMLAVKLTPFEDNSNNRGAFIPTLVEVDKREGASQAWVEFGYAENGKSDDFFCTSREEACVATVPTQTNPFRFYSEAQEFEAMACSEGCVIQVPAIAGRVVYYRTRYFNDDGEEVYVSPRRLKVIF